MYQISTKKLFIAEKPSVAAEFAKVLKVNGTKKNGYIESFVEDTMDGKGKKRTYYRITEAGEDYYKDKVEEYILTKDVVERFIEVNES